MLPLVSPPIAAARSPVTRTSPIRQPRLARTIEWIVLLAALVYCADRALPRSWRHLSTDFPNYYITARLLHEGYATHRIYDWTWLQRQKDRMGILRSDQPVVGFVPNPPFSALPVWPLTYWPPLTAKHIWIACNLLLLIGVAVLLRSLTRLEWRRIALIVGLSYPLLRNLEYGQYYVVLLAIITAALFLYVRERRFAAGVLVGIAGGVKIFPIFFLLYFARKRDMRAALGVAAGLLATLAVSLRLFGLEAHRIYWQQVLPWALRGEALDPYALSANSISALLHKLLIFEPQWNPRPVAHAPALFAWLHPAAQMLVLAPAIFLASPMDRSAKPLQLEWSAFLVALLTISTLPSSYHFTLFILPVTVMTAVLLREKKYSALALLAILYLAVSFPLWPRPGGDGWWALAAVPRLYLLLGLCAQCYFTLSRGGNHSADLRIDRWKWAAALAMLLGVQILSTLHHQRGVYDRYGARIAISPDILSAVEPSVREQKIDFIAMRVDGYSLASVGGPSPPALEEADELSHTSARATAWVEEAHRESRIVKLGTGTTARIEVNARSNASRHCSHAGGLRC